MNMTSNCIGTERTSNANDHHMPLSEPPMQIFCVRHWLFLLYRNIMTFDALLPNLCHASTNWWKVNKHKNLV